MSAISDIEELQSLLGVTVDGDIGRKTKAAVAELTNGAIAASVQQILVRTTRGLKIDGMVGTRTLQALEHLDDLGDEESLREMRMSGGLPFGPRFKVKASSFADPADVRSFHRCKAEGKSDQACFKVGDNGIGKWGANTAQEIRPMIALPREIWRDAGKTGGDLVKIFYVGPEGEKATLTAELGDTMPALANIKNGAGMDMNPAVAKYFGLRPPFMAPVEWEWA